jgi:hypothetical protein
MVRKRSNVAQTLRPSFPSSTLGSKESSKSEVTAWAVAAPLNFMKEFERANVWTGRTYQNVTVFCCMQSDSRPRPESCSRRATTCVNASCIDCFAGPASKLSAAKIIARTRWSISSLVICDDRRLAGAGSIRRHFAPNRARHLAAKDAISRQRRNFRTDVCLSATTDEA